MGISLLKQLNKILLVKLCVLLLAITCKIVFFLLFLVYSALFAFIDGRLIEFIDEVSIILDVLLNVTGQYPLTHTLVKKGGVKHGNRLYTISADIGKNQRINKISNFGIWINKYILDKLDRNHIKKAIENNNIRIINEYNKIKQ